MMGHMFLNDHCSHYVCTLPSVHYTKRWGTQALGHLLCTENSLASVVVVRIYQQLLFPFRHGGNQVCSLLIFEEFTVLHHFLSLQGMFRNSYLSNVMLPYKATAAPGPYSALVFCVIGMRAGACLPENSACKGRMVCKKCLMFLWDPLNERF